MGAAGATVLGSVSAPCFSTMVGEARSAKGAHMSADVVNAKKNWMRIPDGTKVRLLPGDQEGVNDGLTEFVVGTGRNPDGRTQYRIKIGTGARVLVPQDGLLVLTDADGIVLMVKENVEYRRVVTQWLRVELSTDRFTQLA